ncbi:MAG: hypothetical protein K8R02_06935 [Anaerohalosphaeraceae bacterium]|nr:hypothetical protein [Anaerohalosphaeraceae bacterium]
MKTKNRIIVSVILLCVILVPTVMLIELFTAMQGDGFFFGTVYRPLSPCWYYSKDLDKHYYDCKNYIANKEDASEEDWCKWPPAEFIDANSKTITLSKEQPYREHGILVFDSKAGHAKYLYKPGMGLEDENYWEMKNYGGVIALCNLAKREEPKGVYHSYGEDVKQTVIDETGGERWECWAYSGNRSIKSALPPVPGAIFLYRNNSFSDVTINYPRNLLSALKAIYPKLEVPKDAILD